MTNNLRINLALIAVVMFIFLMVTIPFLIFKKTEIYNDNLGTLFSRSEVVMTNQSEDKRCYIADYTSCDYILYRDNKYKVNYLDPAHSRFFNSIWVSDKNKFIASPIEFGELYGQWPQLDDLCMIFMATSGAFGILAPFGFLFGVFIKWINRWRK